MNGLMGFKWEEGSHTSGMKTGLYGAKSDKNSQFQLVTRAFSHLRSP